MGVGAREGIHSWSTAADPAHTCCSSSSSSSTRAVVSTRLSGLLKGHLLPQLNKAPAEARPASRGPKAEAFTRANTIRCEFAVYKLCMPTTQQLATRLPNSGGGRGELSVASGGLKKQISGAYSTRLSGICGTVIVSLAAAVRGVLRMG